MGYTAHHAIVATSFDAEHIEHARQKAIDIFGEHSVSELLQAPVNVFYSFLIGPDGSKEGWRESDRGDECRALWKEAMLERRPADEDGHSERQWFVDWAEVRYGDDDDTPSWVVADSAPESLETRP